MAQETVFILFVSNTISEIQIQKTSEVGNFC